jgi:hypothetical protein
MSFLTTIAFLVIGTVASALCGPPCAVLWMASAVQAGQPARQQPEDFESADQLLIALEESGKGLEALTAGIKYDRTFEIQGDRQIRTGQLQFIGGEPDPQDPSRMVGRRFAIVFRQFWIGDERRDEERAYIFDGQILYEKIPADRLMLVTPIAEPGEQFDPLKIGEGPLPIPIGQRKADILARYQAELVPATDGIDPDADPDPVARRQAIEMLQVAASSWQLKLIPRPGQDDQFREIRLWYTRGADGQLLPRMARTVNRSEDISVVMLVNVQARMKGEPTEKARISEELFDTTAPAGWTVDRKDLRKALESER